MTRPTIYIVSDGKPGHLNQSRGLAAAIGRIRPVRVMELPAKGKRTAPQPEDDAGLILAAGRRTHTKAYALRKYLGVPAVALMNPGWIARQRFNLSIIPRHDGVPASQGVILTEGALNTITPATNASPTEGLVLIGGPSKHHHWEQASLISQLHTLLAREKDMRWTVTSSRRTPESTDKLLRECAQEHSERFEYVPASKTPQGWVAEQLQRCGVCWVSEDSVSMVYESLTAGARVGLIDVPRKGAKPGRVVRGVISLIDRAWVTPFDTWVSGTPLPEDREPLAEADRAADAILRRWPKLNG
jgi:hypothetical protein